MGEVVLDVCEACRRGGGGGEAVRSAEGGEWSSLLPLSVEETTRALGPPFV